MLTSRFQMGKLRFRGLYMPVPFLPESICGFPSLSLCRVLWTRSLGTESGRTCPGSRAGIYLACCPPRAGGPLAPIPAGRRGGPPASPGCRGRAGCCAPTVILTAEGPPSAFQARSPQAVGREGRVWGEDGHTFPYQSSPAGKRTSDPSSPISLHLG